MVKVIRPENVCSSGTSTGVLENELVVVEGFSRFHYFQPEVPQDVAEKMLGEDMSDADASRLLSPHFGT